MSPENVFLIFLKPFSKISKNSFVSKKMTETIGHNKLRTVKKINTMKNDFPSNITFVHAFSPSLIKITCTPFYQRYERGDISNLNVFFL